MKNNVANLVIAFREAQATKSRLERLLAQTHPADVAEAMTILATRADKAAQRREYERENPSPLSRSKLAAMDAMATSVMNTFDAAVAVTPEHPTTAPTDDSKRKLWRKNVASIPA